MDEVECIIVGAGVVGLACGAALARSGRAVLLLEAEDAIGTQSSSRNSEVIHAGIYYEPRSLKAELCRRGRDRLYRYAADRDIPHKRTGKLIVATAPEQVARLQEIKANARANNVTDLELLSADEARRLEPAISCDAALLSPSTGIVDSSALMQALEAEIEDHGGMVVLHTPVAGARVADDGIIVETIGREAGRIRARYLINATGLDAQDLARSIEGLAAETIPQAHFAKGHYFRLSGQSPCSHLIYPLPEKGGLGIHLTLDLGGQARFGPDVSWVERVDYGFDGPEIHGARGVINLFGIESPGLTASLAIGDHVAAMLG